MPSQPLPDDSAETWTEWGVRRTWGVAVGEVGYFERDRRTAEKCAREWPGELVSRTVTASEWATRCDHGGNYRDGDVWRCLTCSHVWPVASDPEGHGGHET